MKRALIALSGGVDSSVAALLMKEAGYDCTGATMRLYEYAMLNYYRQPVSWVNRWLLSAGAPPLTSFIDGYDEDGHSLVS